MATAQTTKPATTPAVKKEPVSAYERLNDQLRRAAGNKKLNAEELDKLSALASALKVLVTV